MASLSADVLLVGLGPGGEAMGPRLATAGLDVVGVDERLVGGECPYYGCIPSKMVVRAGNVLAEARRVDDLAGSASVKPDWAPVARRIAREATTDWDDEAAVERFTASGARFVRGRARLLGGGRVAVGGDVFEASRGIVLNVGTRPTVPPIEGLSDTPFWTNRDALAATSLPASLCVIGGGPIGMELAQAMARCGAHVTVVEAADRLVTVEEPEVSAALADVLRGEGVDVRTEVGVRRVDHDSEAFTIELDGGAITAEGLLVAAGRTPNLDGLGLEAIGLDPDARVLEPDGQMQVAPGVWALGDVTGKGPFTHVSMYQSEVAARAILGEPGPDAAYHAVPHVTFTDPEIGGVGMTEAAAREAGIAVGTGLVEVSGTTRGFLHGPGGDGLIKLVADTERGVLVGATAMGPSGGEVLGLLTLAVHERTPLERLEHMITAFPTFHRGIADALTDLGAT